MKRIQINNPIKTVKEWSRIHKSIEQEISDINILRMFYLSIVAVPVHLIHVIMFYMKSELLTEFEQAWRKGIMSVHGFQVFFMSLLFFILFYFKNKKIPLKLYRALQHFFIIYFIFLGIVIVTIDQYVTTNITPYILILLIVGILFLVNPLQGLVYYSVSYAGFYFGAGILQTDQAIVLTNRVNGITALAISYLVSFFLWNANQKNILQNRKILSQQDELEKTNITLARINEKLEKLSTIDDLTGIYNRRFFNLTLEREFHSHRRSGQPLSILMGDVDYFKNYNDALGHQAGDHCLKEIANALEASLKRPADIATRFGGEEFALILPDTDKRGAWLVAEEIHRKVAKLNIPHPASHSERRVTVSIGIACIRKPGPEDSASKLLKQADQALYYAKENGRNRTEINSPEVQSDG